MTEHSLSQGGGVGRRSLLSLGLAAALPLPAFLSRTDDRRAASLFARLDQAEREYAEAERAHDLTHAAIVEGMPARWADLSVAARDRWASVEVKRVIRHGFRAVEDRMMAAETSRRRARIAAFRAVFRDPDNAARQVEAIRRAGLSVAPDEWAVEVDDMAEFEAAIRGLSATLLSILNRES